MHALESNSSWLSTIFKHPTRPIKFNIHVEMPYEGGLNLHK